MADSIRGRFLWHELITSDTKAAAAFYGKIIGWKTEAWPHTPGYILFKRDRQMAGLMPLQSAGMPATAPPFWMSYIGTPSVDETVKQVVALGGKVEKAPADIPTIGRYAVLSDPQGAGFIAFTPLPQPGRAAPPAQSIGDFSWHELATTDWKGALAFYKACFGWEATSAMDMGEMGMYQMFGIGGVPMGGIFNKPPHMQGPPAWLPYILVPDSKKTVAEVKVAGGQIINGPMEVPGGDWIAQGIDPQGGFFAVHSLNPANVAAVAAAKPRPAKKATAAKKKAAPKKKVVAKKKVAPKKKVAARKKKAAPKRKKSAPKRKVGRKKK